MDRTTMLALVVFSSALILFKAESATFTLTNTCPYTVWPATLGNSDSVPLPLTGFELPMGATMRIDAPPGWRGRLWARRDCSTDSGRFHCLTGDCGSGQVACNGAGGAPPVTLAEIALQGDGGKDFYDVSNVDGFTLPVSVTPQDGTGDCRTSTCPANINRGCPPAVA